MGEFLFKELTFNLKLKSSAKALILSALLSKKGFFGLESKGLSWENPKISQNELKGLIGKEFGIFFSIHLDFYFKSKFLIKNGGSLGEIKEKLISPQIHSFEYFSFENEDYLKLDSSVFLETIFNHFLGDLCFYQIQLFLQDSSLEGLPKLCLETVINSSLEKVFLEIQEESNSFFIQKNSYLLGKQKKYILCIHSEENQSLENQLSVEFKNLSKKDKFIFFQSLFFFDQFSEKKDKKPSIFFHKFFLQEKDFSNEESFFIIRQNGSFFLRELFMDFLNDFFSEEELTFLLKNSKFLKRGFLLIPKKVIKFKVSL